MHLCRTIGKLASPSYGVNLTQTPSPKEQFDEVHSPILPVVDILRFSDESSQVAVLRRRFEEKRLACLHLYSHVCSIM